MMSFLIILSDLDSNLDFRAIQRQISGKRYNIEL